MAKNKSAKIRSVQERKVSSASPAPLQNQPSRNPRNVILICVLLFGLTVAVFFPATRNDFFYWYGDDTGYVTENSHVNTGLTLENVKWAFRNIDVGNWHPLTWLSHMLDSQLYGLKPSGHHLTSVLLHAANAVLLFLALRKMTCATWRCLIVALLFGLHPLRVESVAWVAERKDVLAAFFWMLTLLLYARFAEESKARSPKSKVFYAAALAGFACGLMSKGMVVTLPFVLLLLDYWPLKRHEQKSTWKFLLEKVPFFCLAIATSVITYAAQKNWGFVQTTEKYSLTARLENAVVSYGRYVGKMFWPVDLCGYYPHPGHWPTVIVFLAAVFVIGLSILSLLMRRKWPWMPVGWFWYLGTLVPVIGLVQLGDVAMADRYSYIPAIGILIFTIWGLYDLTKRWRYQNQISWAAIATLLVSCAMISRQQITYFKDGVTAWRHNFEVTGNIEVAQLALGLSLSRQGRTEEGIKELQAVLKAKPDSAEIHFNLGNMFQREGRVDESIHHYREAVKYAPDSHKTRFNLGLQLYHKGLMAEGIAEIQEAVRLNEEKQIHDANVYHTFGTMLATAGRLDEAINSFQKALKVMPNALGAHLNLAKALAERGRPEEAIHHFEEVLKLDPNRTDARTYLDSLKKAKQLPTP